MQKKIVTGFIWFAALVLMATAIAKFISVGGATRILDQPDPLLKIKYRQLFFGVAVMETVVATVLFASRANFFRLALIAWVATNFMLYRLGLWWLNPPKPCGCLGTVTDALGIAPKTADQIMLGVLLVLLLGSYGLLLKEWLQKKSESTSTGPADPKPEAA